MGQELGGEQPWVPCSVGSWEKLPCARGLRPQDDVLILLALGCTHLGTLCGLGTLGHLVILQVSHWLDHTCNLAGGCHCLGRAGLQVEGAGTLGEADFSCGPGARHSYLRSRRLLHLKVGTSGYSRQMLGP